MRKARDEISKVREESYKSEIERAAASKTKDKVEVEMRKHVTELPINTRTDNFQSFKLNDEL